MRPSFLILYLALSTAFVPVAAVAAAAATQRTTGSIPAGLQAALKPVESYRQLPLAAGLARLSGEIDTRLVPVYLLPFEAARPMRFRLSYMSAVSVLPEGSRLTLSINDVVVGERELRATSNPEALTFDVPAGLLESGFNAVRITVRHAHRVDCSRDASYELWTLILPEQSGFAISGPAVELRDIRDLPAVRPTTAGVIRIRVRANPSADSATLARHSRAVQAAVVIGRFSRPIVDVEADDSGEPGLDILVGVDATLAPVLGAMPAGAGPRLHVVHDAQTDRVNLVVTGSTPEEVEAALRSFENAAMNGPRPLGSAAGLRSVWAENGFRVEGGERITLTQLGFSTQRFAGRYYRQSGIIQMPSDFYPGDYGRMVLNVDAAYAADLLPASRINVRVNGAVASTLSLQKSGGQTLTKRAAFLPLSAFKPGANTVAIEAETASAADAECSPTALSLPRDRFLLSQSSELVIPSLARIATFPSLSGVMAGSVTTSLVGAKKQIFIPRPSRELIDATFTLLGKIAAVSGGIAPVEFSFERPPEGAGHTLTLGALSDIPPSTLLAAGLDPEALQRAWHGEPEAHPETRLSATPVRLALAQREWLTSSAPAASWALDPASPHEHAATLGDQLEGGRFETGDNVNRSDGAEDEDNLLERVAHIAAEAEEALRALLPFEFGERGLAAAGSESTSVVKKTTSLVVAQGVAMKDLGQTRRLLPEVSSSTVIVSPTPELLQSSLSELLTSQLWQQLTGATAAFDLSQSQVHTANPESQALVPTQALSINNARLIAAGWLSHNVGIYTGVMALLALLLTALTYRLVRQTGVQE